MIRRFFPELALLVLLSIFLLPLCGFIYGCGCSFLWSGALKHCSIYDPERPDCPWCIVPTGIGSSKIVPFLFQMIPFAAIYLSAIAAIQIKRRFRGPGYRSDFLIGLLALIGAAILIAWIYGKATGYPYFLQRNHISIRMHHG